MIKKYEVLVTIGNSATRERALTYADAVFDAFMWWEQFKTARDTMEIEVRYDGEPMMKINRHEIGYKSDAFLD